MKPAAGVKRNPSRAALIAAWLPVNVMLETPLPLPLENVKPVVVASASVPLVAESDTLSVAASISDTASGLPPAEENTSTVSRAVSCAAGTVLTGASLTAVTLRLALSLAREKGELSPLMNASARPPLLPALRSQARKLMALAMLPLKLATGWKYRRVDAGSAAKRRADDSLTAPSASQLPPLSIE